MFNNLLLVPQTQAFLSCWWLEDLTKIGYDDIRYHKSVYQGRVTVTAPFGLEGTSGGRLVQPAAQAG